MLILHLPRAQRKLGTTGQDRNEWTDGSETRRWLIGARDVNTGEEADRRGRRRTRISETCQFHSFVLLCSLLFIYSVSPCQARPFSLIESQVGIIDQNSLTPASYKNEGRSSHLNSYIFPSDSYVELVAEKQQPQARRKLFTEKIFLYEEEPKEKFDGIYSYVERGEQAASPASANSRLDEQTNRKLSGTDVMQDASVTESSAMAPSEKGPASKNHSIRTLVLPAVTPTEKPITAEEEKKPEVVASFAKDSTAITTGMSPTETVASVPINFHADPFTLSPGVTPEIHDRLFPQQTRPIASLIEELGSVL